MRRMWAAGAVIVMCLALSGVPAMAQDESPLASVEAPSGPAVVSGVEDCSRMPCDDRLSDPRVTGPGWVTFLGETYVPGGSAVWGTYRIEGPEGEWMGPWGGTCIESIGRCEVFVTVEGTGAYEGLSFAYINIGGQVNGIIHEGPALRLEWPEPSPSPESE